MIKESKNKMMGDAPIEKKVELAIQEYHFAGSGIYFPQTVQATGIEAATAIWKQTRREINPNQKQKTDDEV